MNSIAKTGLPTAPSILPTPTVQNSFTTPEGTSLQSTSPGLNTSNLDMAIHPTSSGGISFPAAHAASFGTAVTTSGAQTPSPDLSQFVTSSQQTPNGGTIGVDGSGQPVGYNASANFNIDTSSAVPSSALGSGYTANDLSQKHSQYQDYVQGLAQAQGYSPEYIQALQATQQAQTAGAQLNLNQNLINSNQQTGAGFTGFSTDQATTRTGQEQAQNSLNQGVNQIAQLSANQALQVQALVRSGNIAAAQALVQASQPVGVSPGTSLVSPTNGQEVYSGLGGLTAVNSLNQANSLQQAHPDANIPPYDPSTMTPQSYQQLAMQAVASSPSFQSSTPEGQANISSLVTQQAYADVTNRAYQTATSNLGTLQTFMQQHNLNDSQVPIINQINNGIKNNLIDPGAVAAYQSSLAGLRAEYAQVLSRGGTVTDTERNAAETLIPDNLSPAQLATVTKQLTLEGTNAITEANSQVKAIQARLDGSSNATSQSSSNSTSSSGWY